MFVAPAPVPAAFTAPGGSTPRPAAESGPPPTAEQAAVVDGYLTGHHLVVEAAAGSGKTSTLRMLAWSQSQRPGLYLAYNRTVATQAAGRFPAGVDCRTAHSLAFAAVGRRFAHRLPSFNTRQRGEGGARRLPASEVARILGLRGERIGVRYLTGPALARVAEATVSAFSRSVDVELGSHHVPPVPGVDSAVGDVAEVVLPAARRLWADLCNTDGRLWFTHDHYLKMWQLTDPVLPVEYVMLDEAQDADPVIAAVVARQDHAQRIYVGDRSQAIYAWRGAVDAMRDMDGLRLQLTRSFRFGPAIAEEANRWLDMLRTDLRVVGHDPITSTVGAVERPAAVLCRTNGGSIGAVMTQLDAGRRVALVGDGVEIKRFAFAARSLMDGRGCDLPELAAFSTWRQLCEYVKEEQSGRDLQVMVNMVNQYGPSTLIDTVNRLDPVARAEVVVSTSHKAKGLEWSTVRVGDDFAPPEDGEAPDPAELMLAYVAVTRAQHQLDRGSLAWPMTGALDAGRWRPTDTTRSDEKAED